MYRTPKADQQNISDIRAAADNVEEKTDLVTYLGFCQPGTAGTGETKWSILKIEQSGTVQPVTTSIKWAQGRCSFDLSFDLRDTYNYKFKNF